MKKMKKLQVSLVTLTLLMAFALPASAQKFHYGVKAGVNMAVQSGIAEYYNNGNIRVGLTAGLVGNYHLNDNMMLQAELDYDQKGSHSTNIDTKYDYLSIPVLFDYSFGHTYHTKMSVHLNAGPYVAFLTRAQKVEKIDGANKTTNLMDASHKTEAGAMIGVGFRQPVGKHFLFWDVRLTVGITHFDIADTGSRNKMISVSMGYEL
jgi:long-subunit fatty acid transport protein